MKASQFFFPTLRQEPADAELVSHKLLARAGFIRRVSAGIYSFLPLGWRVLSKIENIVREEMNRIGAQEIFMPAVQPAELWQESGRWDTFGPELLKMKDREGRDLCIATTHEEASIDLIRGIIKSYRQLPLLLYHIQTKFRDEPRPRGGLIRCREFRMKDLYSFDIDEQGLERTFQRVWEAYERILKRCGFAQWRVVEASGGVIGGKETKEFIVEVPSGEDAILFCDKCHYAATLEMAKSGPEKPKENLPEAQKPLTEVFTPCMKTVEEVCNFLGTESKNLVKTLLYKADGQVVAALIRGDREINATKLQRLLGSQTLEMADEETIVKISGAPVGFAGPIGLKGIKIIADLQVMEMQNFITGANKADVHFVNVNVGRDFQVDLVEDIKVAKPQDRCPNCDGSLQASRGIEVGHIFKLGTEFSEKMGAWYLDPEGNRKLMVMGCYGLGTSRLVATVVEVSHDENGIIWPASIAPYQVIILLLDIRDKEQTEVANQIYQSLISKNIEVLLDDRDERAGVKFKDADLIGFPIQIIVGSKLKGGKVEIRQRKDKSSFEVEPDKVTEKVWEILEV